MPEKISVIVPVYNVKPYLERCIKSILAQQYSHLEILLVDDGSTDGSAAVCDKYQRLDARVRVIHQPNQGLSAARNTALDRASGDYIGFVDGDDFISPQMYNRLYELIQKHRADVAVCGIQPVGETGLPIASEIQGNGSVNNINQDIVLPSGKDAVKCCLLGFDEENRINMGVCNKLYHKTLWEHRRFPLKTYFEDSFVMVRLMDSVNRAALCQEKLYYYVQRQGSISHNPLCYFDLIKGGEDWYYYISVQYPSLEQAARKKLLTLYLIWAELIMGLGNTHGASQVLSAIQESAAQFDISSCGLSASEQTALKLLLKSTRAFYIAVKTSAANRSIGDCV